MTFDILLVMLMLAVAGVGSTCPESNDSALTPHPINCAQYYDPSAPAQSGYWEDHLQECPFPQVFNTEAHRCEHYTMVDCGNRTQPIGRCDYRVNNCERSHCIPCYVFYANCKGLPDGFNPHKGKEWSPSYAICKDQRTVYQGNCGTDFNMHVFDPDKRMCIKYQ